MDKVKAFLEKYNVSIAIVGSAIVLSTMFGQCSYDYQTGDVSVETNPQEILSEKDEE